MSVVNEHFSTIVPHQGESSELLLADIAAQAAACRKCALCEGRTNVVPGFGNPEARVMLIGEAPGKNEDLQGRPFVGAAGKYLTELLGYAGLTRDEVFIANVLKCRPPSNRNPQPDEIERAGSSCTRCSILPRRSTTAANARRSRPISRPWASA